MVSHANYGTNVWPGRPPKQRCYYVRKDGTQCKSWAVVGYKCCYYHGGKGALAKLGVGNQSPRMQAIIKGELLKVQNALAKVKELYQPILDNTNNSEELLQVSNRLSAAMIDEMVKAVEDLTKRLNKTRDRLDHLIDLGTTSKQIEVLINLEAVLTREINNIRDSIQKQQAQITNNIKTKKYITPALTKTQEAELKELEKQEDILRNLNQRLVEVECESYEVVDEYKELP